MRQEDATHHDIQMGVSEDVYNRVSYPDNFLWSTNEHKDTPATSAPLSPVAAAAALLAAAAPSLVTAAATAVVVHHPPERRMWAREKYHRSA